MAKSWIERTSFGDHVAKMSYKELIEQFGEDRGAEVAKHFGIKKKSKPFVSKKKEESTEGQGEL